MRTAFNINKKILKQLAQWVGFLVLYLHWLEMENGIGDTDCLVIHMLPYLKDLFCALFFVCI